MKKQKQTKKAKTSWYQVPKLDKLPEGIQIRTELFLECTKCSRRERFILTFFKDPLGPEEDADNLLYKVNLALKTSKCSIEKSKFVCSKCTTKQYPAEKEEEIISDDKETT